MTVELALSGIGLAAWLYLLLARGGFWRTDIRDEVGVPNAPAEWSLVLAVIPARNEADVIAKTLTSLLNQDYTKPLNVILVDDQSDDGTADAARAAGERAGGSDRLTILRGEPLPQGWTGKLWAMRQGVTQASSLAEPPRYVLLTDADIAYEPGVIRRLVARAEAGSLVLTSLMVRLPLRKSRRARPHSGFRLLLPDALSLRLDEPPRQHDGRGCRRLHAREARRTRSGRRDRGNPLFPH